MKTCIRVSRGVALRGVAFTLAALCATFAQAQRAVTEFGKNKVRHTRINWKVVESPHFSVSYYGEGENNAHYIIQDLEDFFTSVSPILNVGTLTESSPVYYPKSRRNGLANRKRDHKWERENAAREWEKAVGQKLPVYLYNSHTDFQQTNLIDTFSRLGLQMPLGVLGVTEGSKNRNATPFEGSLAALRATIRHEVVHQILNVKLASKGFLLTQRRHNLHGWPNEGLAEFLSTGWDTRKDMYMRLRYIASNALLPFKSWNAGYAPYVAGTSVYRFLTETYGVSVIQKILETYVVDHDIIKAISQVTDLDSAKELEVAWHVHLRKYYGAELDRRIPLQAQAKVAIRHTRGKNRINASPAISPDGKHIAYYSDRERLRMGIAVASLDARDDSVRTLVQDGNSTFEEFQFLSQGGQYRSLAYSRDGGKIALAAKKSGVGSVLYVLNAKSGDPIFEYESDRFSSLFAPAFSPDGRTLAFVGVSEGQTDLFTLELSTRKVRRLTNDIWADFEPVFDSRGDYVYFVSERLKSTRRHGDFSYSPFQKDLIRVRVADLVLENLTDTPTDESSPVVNPSETKIAYVSDANGIFNVWLGDLQTGVRYPITNVDIGVNHISLSSDGSKLAVGAYADGGDGTLAGDIYVMDTPFEKPRVDAPPTQFELERQRGNAMVPFAADKNWDLFFGVGHLAKKPEASAPPQAHDRTVASVDEKYAQLPAVSDGVVPLTEVQKYKLRFTLDFLSLFYSGGGSNGSASTHRNLNASEGGLRLGVSDLAGNHSGLVIADFTRNAANSYVLLKYLNRRNRTTLEFDAYHFGRLYRVAQPDGLAENEEIAGRYRIAALRAGATYPIDRFRRIEGRAFFEYYQRDLQKITRIENEDDDPSNRNDDDEFQERHETLESDRPLRKIEIQAAYVGDTTVEDIYGPKTGSRYKIYLLYAPQYTRSALSYQTAMLDVRKYFALGVDTNFTTRFSAGASMGPDPQQMLVGGQDLSLGAHWEPGVFRPGREFHNSRVVTPFRGTNLGRLRGRNYMMTNAEFRFPLLFPRHIVLTDSKQKFGIGAFDIRGALFLDAAAAWNDRLDIRKRDTGGKLRFEDFLTSYGIGLRAFLGIAVVRTDAAWVYDGQDVSKPHWSLTLARDF